MTTTIEWQSRSVCVWVRVRSGQLDVRTITLSQTSVFAVSADQPLFFSTTFLDLSFFLQFSPRIHVRTHTCTHTLS